MPKFIRQWLSRKFNLCCEIHDQNYNDISINRFNCDKIFLRDMINVCQKDRYVIIAIGYYFTVRLFGKPFKKNKE